MACSLLILAVFVCFLVRLNAFMPEDIHNADKTGLFYKLRPDKSLVYSNRLPWWKKRQRQVDSDALCQHDWN